MSLNIEAGDMDTRPVVFVRRLSDGSVFRLGVASYHPSATEPGWRFYPNLAARRVSRKRHATMEACLPRWLGYPKRCESYHLVEGR